MGWHGSWLNMAEIELAVLAGQCLDRRLGRPGDPGAGGVGEEHRESIRAFLAMIDSNTGYIGDD